MDNASDPRISFENDGTCSYCNYALSRKDSTYFPNAEGERRLALMINELKREGKGKEFDCLMGLSGGLDSSYLAYLGAKKWGLRILAVHVDDGFDTEIARSNIERLSGELKIKLITEKLNYRQYYDVIKAFVLAGVPGIANIQDNIIKSSLLKTAKDFHIRSFLSGQNFASESILESGIAHNASDGYHIKAIHKAFGTGSIEDLPIIGLLTSYVGQRYIWRIKRYKPLNLIEYNIQQAISELRSSIGFEYYDGKHYESLLTQFTQKYYLPRKFSVDKRKSHLSSLIISGQISRDEALRELRTPIADEGNIEHVVNAVLEKIGIGREEFKELMDKPGISHDSYRTSWLSKFSRVARKYRKILTD